MQFTEVGFFFSHGFSTACVWGKLWGSFSYPYHGLTWGHSWDCCAWAYWCDCEYGGHHRHRSDHQHHGTATQETYTDHDGHYNSSEDLRGGCEGFWEGYDKHCKFVKLVEPPVLRTLMFKPWVFPSLFIIFDHFSLYFPECSWKKWSLFHLSSLFKANVFSLRPSWKVNIVLWFSPCEPRVKLSTSQVSIPRWMPPRRSRCNDSRRWLKAQQKLAKNWQTWQHFVLSGNKVMILQYCMYGYIGFI